jgi:hypothetical protein
LKSFLFFIFFYQNCVHTKHIRNATSLISSCLVTPEITFLFIEPESSLSLNPYNYGIYYVYIPSSRNLYAFGANGKKCSNSYEHVIGPTLLELRRNVCKLLELLILVKIFVVSFDFGLKFKITRNLSCYVRNNRTLRYTSSRKTVWQVAFVYFGIMTLEIDSSFWCSQEYATGQYSEPENFKVTASHQTLFPLRLLSESRKSRIRP